MLRRHAFALALLLVLAVVLVELYTRGSLGFRFGRLPR